MPGTLRQAIDSTTPAMLRARGSFKWTAPGPDGFGAAVAEMDFGAAPAILDALAGLSADANFGYLPPFLADELAAACAEFQKRRYGWDTDPALIHHVPDVIKALEIAITRFSRPGSPVILPTPAYMPFLSVPGFVGRDIIQVRMRDDNGFFTLDLDAIEDAFRAGGAPGHLLQPLQPARPGLHRTGDDRADRRRGPARRPGLRRRDPRPARLSGHAPRPVRVDVGHGRGAHPDRHLRLEGLEPARPQVRAGHPHQRGRPAALGGDGFLRRARGEQSRRRRQHRRVPARRGMAGRGRRLPGREPPPAGRPDRPAPAPGALPPARRHLPRLARLHGDGPAGSRRASSSTPRRSRWWTGLPSAMAAPDPSGSTSPRRSPSSPRWSSVSPRP